MTVGAVVRVLVFGGSQGAHAINVAMVEAAQELAARGSGLRLTHQTGPRDREMVRAGYEQAGLAAEVESFYDDMGQKIRRADLIVCRAGATTLAEVTAAGKAAILVPLPTATDDHQRKNAAALAAVGAAEVLLQPMMNGHTLAHRIMTLAADPIAAGADGGGGAIAGAAGRGARHRRSGIGIGGFKGGLRASADSASNEVLHWSARSSGPTFQVCRSVGPTKTRLDETGSARQNAKGALRRRRRHRHERHCRAIGEPGLRGQRLR